jgi:hypothetical protein
MERIEAKYLSVMWDSLLELACLGQGVCQVGVG